jgi:hypothetical protein
MLEPLFGAERLNETDYNRLGFLRYCLRPIACLYFLDYYLSYGDH